MELKYKVFNENVMGMHKDSADDAGFDLFARQEVTLQPQETALIGLNVAIEMPCNSIVGLLFQRSSTYRKWGVRLTNNVGVIDFKYRGDGDEWMGEFKNETDKPITIKVGDKICQALFLQLAPITAVSKVDQLGNADRGGFGTTGTTQEDVK